ncbi:MAG TPA: lysine--tRNA ligase [Candidatus Saccharimonadales bacterium]|nr:lysine--tRNA ligase [Candidatus Saccharimonadales bacterium]
MTEPKSNYWLDLAADEIIKKYPDGEIIVSSGISPSASYHIGHYREIMTADALAWAVRQRGRKATHIHVVDNFDPLRKWYDFLPKVDKDYSGHPVCLIPDPFGDCHKTYADHFYAEFEKSLKPMGIGGEGFEILKSYEQLYSTGRMVPHIETVLEKIDQVREIVMKFGRDVAADWTPVQYLDKADRFVKADVRTWDKQGKTINGVSYDDGMVKLDWRLDWPARWKELDVNVEPFGAQEHGAAGGSYDTGMAFARQIFGVEPPYGEVRYGHMHRPGENVKMSSSKGNVVTPDDALKIMPAELLRYFIVRSRPEKKIFFDPGLGLYNLVDEFAAAQSDANHEFRDAYEFAVAGSQEKMITSVPFKHLVQVYQAAQGDFDEVLELLQRTDWEPEDDDEKAVLEKELKFVENWLAKYAPEEVKFEVQKKLPDVDLAAEQKKFMDLLAGSIGKEGQVDGQRMHELIYAAKDAAKVDNKSAFQSLYRVILGKDYGPKAGWFLASLDRDWLVGRLRLEK